MENFNGQSGDGICGPSAMIYAEAAREILLANRGEIVNAESAQDRRVAENTEGAPAAGEKTAMPVQPDESLKKLAEANPKLAEAIGTLTRLNEYGLLDQALQSLQAMEDELLHQPTLPGGPDAMSAPLNGSTRQASALVYRLLFRGKLAKALPQIESLADKVMFGDLFEKEG